jgi:Tfp pilus assembly protein PilV
MYRILNHMKRCTMRYLHVHEERAMLRTQGFTIVEALVAITVLLLSVAGPMTIAQTGLRNSFFARDQITAFYLAQEGIELIRAQRDNNALDGNPATGWLDGIESECKSLPDQDKWCRVDSIRVDDGSNKGNHTFEQCNPGTCDADVYFFDDSGRGIFRNAASAASGEATIFERSMQVEEINPNEVRILSRVKWRARADTKTIVVESRMFNMYHGI